MIETLFDQSSDRRRSDLRSHQSRFGFLNQTEQPEYVRVREALEDWYAHVPPTERCDLRRRFQQHDDDQFIGAFWELYIHETFQRLGYELRRGDSDKRRPDFLVSGSDQESYFVEATMIPESEEFRKNEQRIARIKKTIDKLRAPDFLSLDMTIEQYGTDDVSLHKLCKELERWFDQLEPGRLAALSWDRWWRDDLPVHRWEEGGWSVVFTAIPLSSSGNRANGQNSLVLSFGPSEPRLVNDGKFITRKIHAKAKHYGELDRPFILALLSSKFTTREHDVGESLYGSRFDGIERPLRQLRPDAQERNGQTTGIWLANIGPAHPRVSAILVANQLEPWTVAREELTLWHHPWARHPLPAALPFRTVRLDPTTNQFRTDAAQVQPWRLFGLPEAWPFV